MYRLLPIFFCLLLPACRGTWKEWEFDQYNRVKQSLIYEDRNVFIYPDSNTIVVAYQHGEWDPNDVFWQLLDYGVTDVDYDSSRAVFDSARFRLSPVVKYFADENHRIPH